VTLINPWVAIADRAPFVLSQDMPFITAHNSCVVEHSDAWINTGYTPEPRLGPVDAPVLILQANPSYDPAQRQCNPDQDEVKRELAGLRDHEASHPGVTEKTAWWPQTLKQLRAQTGNEKLKRGICSVEYFPYRSMKFGHGHIRLPSQQYTFSLVEEALRGGRLIVITRIAQTWFGAVPALADAVGKTVFITKNAQRTFISSGNFAEGVFDRLVQAIGAE
jgi:hypothetical protein